jgi:hypothetical protein
VVKAEVIEPETINLCTTDDDEAEFKKHRTLQDRGMIKKRYLLGYALVNVTSGPRYIRPQVDRREASTYQITKILKDFETRIHPIEHPIQLAASRGYIDFSSLTFDLDKIKEVKWTSPDEEVELLNGLHRLIASEQFLKRLPVPQDAERVRLWPAEIHDKGMWCQPIKVISLKSLTYFIVRSNEQRSGRVGCQKLLVRKQAVSTLTGWCTDGADDNRCHIHR